MTWNSRRPASLRLGCRTPDGLLRWAGLGQLSMPGNSENAGIQCISTRSAGCIAPSRRALPRASSRRRNAGMCGLTSPQRDRSAHETSARHPQKSENSSSSHPRIDPATSVAGSVPHVTPKLEVAVIFAEFPPETARSSPPVKRMRPGQAW